MAKRQLATYRAKRDFSRTAEPSGRVPSRSRRGDRYVIQKHAARRLHFDFRLEADGVLKSWAVPKGPSLDPHEKRLAVEVEDHPLEYGDFEGTIPAGEYGGGTVQLWDKGHWEPVGDESTAEALKRGRLKFRLDGERLHGIWNLVRMRRREREQKNNWLLIKDADADARTGPDADIAETDESVKTGRTMAEIAAGKPVRKGRGPARATWRSNRKTGAAVRTPRATLADRRSALPEFIPPQLATAVEHPPAGPGWAHEAKFDGYRLQLHNHAGTVTVMSRSGLDWTHRFPGLAKAMAGLEDTILDGEAVAFKQGNVPDFSALQVALHDGAHDKIFFYAFDLLFSGGQDLREKPLQERKRRQLELIGPDEGQRLRYVEHFTTGGDAVLRSACRMELEGIVSKRVNAPYRSGRGDGWQKAKCRGRQEFVVGGYVPMKRKRQGLGALVVGVMQNGKFAYAGKVGTGYTEAVATDLLSKLRKLEIKASPFVGRQPDKPATVRWVKPQLIAEVAFAGWTHDGVLRQASFKGLRDDKTAAEVNVRAEPVARPRPAGPLQILGVTISNPDKVLWPEDGITKRELAEYLAAASDLMVPFLKDRPVSIIRAPDGIGRPTFFQRHAGRGTSALIRLIRVPGEDKPYISVGDAAGLVAMAQMGAVEFHPWGCTSRDLMHPDQITFDLDPAPDVPFARVVDAAKEVRRRVELLGFAAYPKTTGGKGLHVVVPLKPKADWAEVKAFAKALCQTMVSDSPDEYVLTMAKKERTGRIFLDYLRNDLTASAVSAWSPRGRAGAPIAVPLAWTAVTHALDPKAFSIRTLKAALKRADDWADFNRRRVALTAAVLKKAA